MFGLYWNVGALPGAGAALPSAIDPAAYTPTRSDNNSSCARSVKAVK
jgi:hypothetical protein